jgi:hypothetical protein
MDSLMERTPSIYQFFEIKRKTVCSILSCRSLYPGICGIWREYTCTSSNCLVGNIPVLHQTVLWGIYLYFIKLSCGEYTCTSSKCLVGNIPVLHQTVLWGIYLYFIKVSSGEYTCTSFIKTV